MNLSYAFLADYAQVEQGKVHVIGGGVTVLWRNEFPAPVGVSVVFGFAYNNVEIGTTRSFKLQITDADGQDIASPLEGSVLLPGRAEGVPTSGVPLEAAFAINIANNVPILPAPGHYVMEISVEGNHVRSLPFAAVQPSAGN